MSTMQSLRDSIMQALNDWEAKSKSIADISRSTKRGRQERSAILGPFREAHDKAQNAHNDHWRVVCCIPSEFARDGNPSDIRQKIHQNFVEAIDGDSESNLVFSGNTGVGKSLSAALVIRSREIRGGYWVQARELSESARQWPLGKGENPDITRAKEALIMVLDDLGLERDHGCLLDVLERRYSRGLPTITTTGLGVGELVERYGDAFVRRLKECAGLRGAIVTA